MTCHSLAICKAGLWAKKKKGFLCNTTVQDRRCLCNHEELMGWWVGAISRGGCVCVGSHVPSVGSGFRPHHHCRIVCIRHVSVVRFYRYIHTNTHSLGLCHADRASMARVRSESEGRFTLAVCCVCPPAGVAHDGNSWRCHANLWIHHTNSTSTLIRPYTRYVEVVWWPSGKSYSRRERESSNFCGIVIKTNPSQSLVLLPSNFCVAVHHARRKQKVPSSMLIYLHLHYPIQSIRTEFLFSLD